MKKNITCLNNCYGCGVCVKACPTKIISLKETSDGFYAPIIQEQDNVSIAVYACVYVHLIMTQLHKTTHQLIHMQPGAILQL